MKKLGMVVIVVAGSLVLGLLLMAPADVDTFMMFRETSVPQLSEATLRRELTRAEVMRKKVERYQEVIADELASR